ncbi:MAG: ATP-grasp domain-containing protein [Acidimicrobiia bacterium]|nr:ATP-grasp domain-containing protein [Acidimicrobiia bacterium]NNF10400.1 ATP-grasp domain-containing protein [Acidimicrobiia bacterium]
MTQVVVVASSQSYRTGDFVRAASLLQADVVVASNAPIPLGAKQVRVDLADPKAAARAIQAAVPHAAAVVAVDDQGVAAASHAARLLGLEHNPPKSVAATRDKLLMRRLLADAGIPQPRWAEVPPGTAGRVAGEIGYPSVLKPVGRSAGQGVIRVDDFAAARRAEARIRSILRNTGSQPDQVLLAEEYLPGDEMVIEGLLVDGSMQVLALIDKPDPLEGPFFEETLLTTPSRHTDAVAGEAVDVAVAAAHALGLHHGPVHAEVRIPPAGPVRLLEIAARSIGGLCGRALSFGLLGESLEVLVLRGALGIAPVDTAATRPAVGVLMLPIPATGRLTAIDGVEEARALDGVDDVTITATIGRRIEALPEGGRYLGFVFASGLSPVEVEQTLRRAAGIIEVDIDGEGMLAAPA